MGRSRRVETVALFAQSIYLIFAAVYICKEALERMLMFAGTEEEGHHHHAQVDEFAGYVSSPSISPDHQFDIPFKCCISNCSSLALPNIPHILTHIILQPRAFGRRSVHALFASHFPQFVNILFSTCSDRQIPTSPFIPP